MLNEKLGLLSTESRNPKSKELDKMTTRDILLLMNQEDENVIRTVREAIPEIEKTVQMVIHALNNGGNLHK